MTTEEVAIFMLERGAFFTAATLAEALNLSIETASGRLYNIKQCKKYETIEKGTPVTVKVVDVANMQRDKRLWTKALASNWS